MDFKKYILVDKKPVEEPDVIKWAMWFEDRNNTTVKYDTIGDVDVSTVFLGLRSSDGCLFETRIFGGEFAGLEERCNDWETAEQIHDHAIKLVKNDK